ncbi:MAG: hypothetical protein ACOYXC_14090 [Candidatus Rifleibacteriota bacterium]
MDNKQLAIILGASALLLLILGFLLSPGKKDGDRDFANKGEADGALRPSHKDERNGKSGSGKSGETSGKNYSSASGSSSRSSFSSSTGSNADYGDSSSRKAYSEEEIRQWREKRAALLKKVHDRKLKWVAGKADDPNLSAKSRYRYRMMLIEGYRDGNKAFNNKDYAEAMRQYMAALKDPDASIETRFTCLTQMRMTAKMLKDYDLYLELMKQQAQIIESEDLSVFGIPKGKGGWPLYESRRRFIMAIKEPGGKEKALQELISEKDTASAEDIAEITQEFEADLNEFKTDFETTREMLEAEG